MTNGHDHETERLKRWLDDGPPERPIANTLWFALVSLAVTAAVALVIIGACL